MRWWTMVVVGLLAGCAPKSTAVLTVPAVPSDAVQIPVLPEEIEHEFRPVGEVSYEDSIRVVQSPSRRSVGRQDSLVLGVQGNQRAASGLEHVLRSELIASGRNRLLDPGRLSQLTARRTEASGGVSWEVVAPWRALVEVIPLGGIDYVLDVSAVSLQTRELDVDRELVISPASLKAYESAYREGRAFAEQRIPEVSDLIRTLKGTFESNKRDYLRAGGTYAEARRVEDAFERRLAPVERTLRQLREVLRWTPPEKLPDELMARATTKKAIIHVATAQVSLRSVESREIVWEGRLVVEAESSTAAIRKLGDHILRRL